MIMIMIMIIDIIIIVIIIVFNKNMFFLTVKFMSWKPVIQSESFVSIKAWLAGSFIGWDFPGEGQAMCFGVESDGQID